MFFYGTRKTVSFLRWSNRWLQEMEDHVQSSEIFVGFPSYLNRLYKAAYTGTYRGTPRSETTAGLLAEFRYRENLTLVVYIVMLFILCFFTIWNWVTVWSNQFGGVTFLIFASGVLGVWALMAVFQRKWMKSIQQWSGYYEALDRWGEAIKGTIHTQPHNSGGSPL